MKYLTHYISVSLLLLLGLAACSSNPKLPQIETTLQAVNFLNPNIYNQPSPVVVTLYQLKSPMAFEQANFYALYSKPAAVLGDDLVDQREVEIRPRQSLFIQQALAPSASYLGIIAAFRDPDTAQWRRIIAMPNAKKITLRVDVESQSIYAQLVK